MADVARTVQLGSLDLPSGTLETSDETLLVRVTEERRDAASLADLIIRSAANGGQVRLGEVATIREQFSVVDDKIILMANWRQF